MICSSCFPMPSICLRSAPKTFTPTSHTTQTIKTVDSAFLLLHIDTLTIKGPGPVTIEAYDVIVANLRGKWPLFIKDSERKIALEMLKRTGAEKLADSEMRNLSGGETQRVFLARALATKPV